MTLRKRHPIGTLVLATLAVLATTTATAAPATPASAPQRAAPARPAASAARAPAPLAIPKLVDINSASIAELKTLPGIGDAEAKKIIANRPYDTKAHLITKKVLDYGPYDLIRTRIRAVQTRAPKPNPR